MKIDELLVRRHSELMKEADDLKLKIKLLEKKLRITVYGFTASIVYLFYIALKAVS